MSEAGYTILLWVILIVILSVGKCRGDALSPKSLFHGNKIESRSAEHEFYRRLEAFGGPVRVMQYKHWSDVKKAAWWAHPGTIFVIDGPYEVWLYFREHGWELIPMRIDGKWIVRKRLGGAA